MRRTKKWFALWLALCMAVPGTAGMWYSDMQMVHAEETTECGTAISEMFDTSQRDNTWLFTGGEVVNGGFDQTRGSRNYVGQFEEYIRWSIANSPINGRQRFAFHIAKEGRTLADIVKNYDNLVKQYKTRAAVYMVGSEDYMQGEAQLEEFKKNLKSFIDQSLELKDGKGFAVIQMPYAVKEEAVNGQIEKYWEAVNTVVAEYSSDSEKFSHIVVVDHYTATKSDDDFKNEKQTADGKLNAKGHLEIARQFAEVTAGLESNQEFPRAGVTLDRKEAAQPEEYPDVMPEVKAGETSLDVVIPKENGTAWNYEVQMENLTVTGTSDKAAFQIKDLPQGAPYVLKIRSQDGKKQLVTTKGKITKDEVAVKNTQVLDEDQQKIADLMKTKDSLTWLFMGDSITHAAQYTAGYDGIVQAFEKYVKEELGRADDIVLNTAVSNANAITTVQELDQRLTNYHPDVVSIMLGTNDCSPVANVSLEQFESNMRTILTKIKEINPNAVILLRTPTPVFDDNRMPNIDSYMAVLEDLRDEFDTMWIDQYTELKEITDTYGSWIRGKLFPDGLHPDANGHRYMTNQFIKACGFWTEDSAMTNLYYDMGITEVTNPLEPEIVFNRKEMGISIEVLEKSSGLSLGDVTIKATAQANGQTYEASVKEGKRYAILSGLPENDTYQVEISGYQTNAAKKVIFESVNVTLSDEQAEESVELILSNRKLKSAKTGTLVGKVSVDGLIGTDSYTYSLCEGEGSKDNGFFEIIDGQLKIKTDLTAGKDYQIRVRAAGEKITKEATFTIYVVSKEPLVERTDLTIEEGSYVDLSGEENASKLLTLEEGTITAEYTSTSTFGVQSLFSMSAGTTANDHFHVYITPAGRLGCEIRTNAKNCHYYIDNAVTAGVKNRIAWKADQENQQYKFFVNGVLVLKIDATDGYRFAKDIEGMDTVWLGAVKRSGAAKYTFGGSIHEIKAYEAVLTDEELIEWTKDLTAEEPAQGVPMESELPKAGSISVLPENKTNDQPFAAGTAGCQKYRIPALITLENGDLLAAADARWTGGADWGGLDTIASVSDDQGKTWYYSFPIYFPDSNEQYPGNQVATTAIDPVLVQGNDGTIYCIADMNPSGITTGDIMPAKGTGFVKIDGKDRLVLTDTYTKPTSQEWATYGDPETYEYYVGDFSEGYAPVLNKADHSATEWCVDEWYNIYQADPETGEPKAKLTQNMVNEDTQIQQNVFYKDSVLHVFNTGYLWLVTSKDHGRTWGNPQILNTQIKRDDDKEVALLASPGQGITTSGGDIVIPFYDHGDGMENASVIWSSDEGKTWKRSNDVAGSLWSSESEVVELDQQTLRMFFRSGTGKICYADITKNDAGEWVMGKGIATNIDVCSTCNVTAIRHSQKINGKTVLLVACPGGSGRANGKIFTFLTEKDHSMTLYNTYEINSGYYAYSCMTEMEDGNIGLLWENAGTSIRFDKLNLKQVLGTEKYVELHAGETYVDEKTALEAAQITKTPDEKIATVHTEFVTETGKTALLDHDSSAGFAKEPGNALVEDAEFTFTASGDYWKIYNEKKSVYLRNDMADAYFGTESEMKVTAVNGTDGMEFKISKTDDTRYILFYYAQMNWNSNSGGYKENYEEQGKQQVVLLEKQATASAEDIVPGYKRVEKITSGKQYLITYITAEGDVIVLYPTNGKNAQTKKVGGTANISKNVTKITAVAPGNTQAVVGEITYYITVVDPKESPTYAGNDYPVEKLTAISESEYPGTANEGPDDYILDGNEGTHWHTNWNTSEASDVEKRWVGVSLAEAAKIEGIRYLPRTGNSKNGAVTEYKVQYRTADDGEWIDIEGATGTWDKDDQNWKLIRFDAVTVKQIRIVGIHTYADSVNGSDKHMSTAEFRIIAAEAEPDEKPEVPDTKPEEKDPVTEVFTDVVAGSWYVDAVQYVYNTGLMSGFQEQFTPNANMSRAMVVTTLYRMEGSPAVSDYSAYLAFKDVKEGDWYADAVAWALNNDIATGDPINQKFNPNANVTREQLAAFLYRYTEFKGGSVTERGDFSDMKNADKVSSWALKEMQWAVGTELISGIVEVKGEQIVARDLAPQGNATRAQMATILQRYCEK